MRPIRVGSRENGGKEVAVAVFVVGAGMGGSWKCWWWGKMKSGLCDEVDDLIKKKILMMQKWGRENHRTQILEEACEDGADPVSRGRVKSR